MTKEIRTPKDQRRWTLIASGVALLFVGSLAMAIVNWPRGQAPTGEQADDRSIASAAEANVAAEAPEIEPVDHEVIRRRAWDRIARHLAPADAAASAAIDKATA